MTEAEKKIRKIYAESTPEQRATAARENNRIEAANQQRALAAKAREERERTEACEKNSHKNSHGDNKNSHGKEK